MKSGTVHSLHDAVEATERVTRFLSGTSLRDYQTDEGLQLQIERLLEIVGEALSRVGKAEPVVLGQIPDARSVIGMRNRITHGYDAIDAETVWSAATYDIPQLRKQLLEILRSDGSDLG